MPDTSPQLVWVKPPLLARSQQTLARLLDAAEALISEGGVEAATVAAVTRRAKSSVGAFYARFADKEALMRCMLERFYEQAAATTDMALDSERWREAALDEALHTLLLFMLQSLRERRHLVVAMMVRAATTPELQALMQRLHQQITQRMAELLEARAAELSHPEPATALHVCIWLVLSAVETRLLYADSKTDNDLDDQQLAVELTRMCVSYLGLNVAATPLSERRAAGALQPLADDSRPAATDNSTKATKRRSAL